MEDLIRHAVQPCLDLNSEIWKLNKTAAELVPREQRSFFQENILAIDSKRTGTDRRPVDDSRSSQYGRNPTLRSSNYEPKHRPSFGSGLGASIHAPLLPVMGEPSGSHGTAPSVPRTPAPPITVMGEPSSSHGAAPSVPTAPRSPSYLEGGDPDEEEGPVDMWKDEGMPSNAPYPFPIPSLENVTERSLKVWRWIVAMAPASREGREVYFTLIMALFRDKGRFQKYCSKLRYRARLGYPTADPYEHPEEFGSRLEGHDIEEYLAKWLYDAGFDHAWGKALEGWFIGTGDYSPKFREWIERSFTDDETQELDHAIDNMDQDEPEVPPGS